MALRGQAGGLLRVLTVVGLALGLWLPAADTHWIEHLPWHQHMDADGSIAGQGYAAALHRHDGSHATSLPVHSLGVSVLAAMSLPDGSAADGVGGAPRPWRTGDESVAVVAPIEAPLPAAREGPPHGRATQPDTPPPQLAFHISAHAASAAAL